MGAIIRALQVDGKDRGCGKAAARGITNYELGIMNCGDRLADWRGLLGYSPALALAPNLVRIDEDSPDSQTGARARLRARRPYAPVG